MNQSVVDLHRTRSLAKSGLPVVLLFIAGNVQAAAVTLQFQSTVLFNPNLVAAAGDITAGELITGAFGATPLPGTLPVTGAVTYETNTAPYQTATAGGQGATNYLNPIVGAQLTINGVAVAPDLALIGANSASALSGTAVAQTGANSLSWCIGCTPAEAQGFGLPPAAFTPTANAILVHDNAVLPVPGEDSPRDGVVFLLGYTPADPEFVPVVPTGIAGNIWLEYFALAIPSLPDQNLFDGTGLPVGNPFADPDLLDLPSLIMVFRGDQADPIAGFGIASDIALVPIPATAWLLVTAIGAFVARSGFLRRRSGRARGVFQA